MNRKDGEGLVVYTIGHSAHSMETFLQLLKQMGITAIADVRSVPYSRHVPQFNKPDIQESLREAGIEYVFLGKELGARPKDCSLYRDDSADFALMAESTTFKSGLERVLKGAARYSIALMCAEKDPLDCHRNILVARGLKELGAVIRHVMSDGQIEENSDTEQRLLKITNQLQTDMFVPETSTGDPLQMAYEKRGRQIAVSEEANDEATEKTALRQPA
ncbi:MAG: DUF488 domain-containing protein [Rhodospirillales bacterium]